MKCSLCGFEFSESEGRSVCEGCVLLKNCSLIKCPRCHFELVPESEVTQWRERFDFRKKLNAFWGRRGKRKNCEGAVTSEDPGMGKTLNENKKIIPLPDLKVGERAEVVRIGTRDRYSLRKMIAMGVFPKTEIELVQKFPSCVFRIGQSQFSADQELASLIYVQTR